MLNCHQNKITLIGISEKLELLLNRCMDIWKDGGVAYTEKN